jgi:hypothetical protein
VQEAKSTLPGWPGWVIALSLNLQMECVATQKNITAHPELSQSFLKEHPICLDEPVSNGTMSSAARPGTPH